MTAMRFQWLFLFLLTLVCALAVLHLVLGESTLQWSALFSTEDSENLSQIIFYELRLPRTLLVILVGAAMAMAGAAMQGLLRNPLADPSLLGVSSGAALGAVIVLYYGLASFSWWLLPIAGVVAGLLSTILVFLLAGMTRNAIVLILSGVAVNALTSSGIALALNFAPNPYAMTEIVHWLLGSFMNRSMQDVMFVLPFIVTGIVVLLTQQKLFSALSLGEDVAQTLGISLQQQRFIVIVAIALMIGAAVSICGSIGFVGLVVPHLLRPLVHYDPARLLRVSALAGAAFLLLADLLVKLLATQQELKIGVVTSLVGAPFFLVLILNVRKQVA